MAKNVRAIFENAHSMRFTRAMLGRMSLLEAAGARGEKGHVSFEICANGYRAPTG